MGGVLFLSAFTKDEETGVTNGNVPFMIRPQDGATIYPALNQLASGAAVVLQHAGAADLSGMVFLGIPEADEMATVASIYYADLRTAVSLDDVMRMTPEATELAQPTDEDYFREHPSISTGQVITYSSISKDQYDDTEGSVAELSAEDWGIYILSAAGSPRKITNGLSPKWVDVATIAFLKNDGVYIYNTERKEERKVWALDFVPNITTGFDVSDRGDFAVIANPAESRMFILRALHWDTALINLFSSVSRSVLSPVFAPDGKHIAMLTTNEDDQIAVAYFSMEDYSFIPQTVAFDNKTISKLYLTDWQ